MSIFVDEVTCRVRAGDGGHGLIAFLREKFRPRGGPCGGDGGRGGNVVFEVDRNLHTLLDFQNRAEFRAERGQHGLGKNMSGKSGKHLVVRVPPGTEIEDRDSGVFLGDLTEHGDRLVVAKGGRGGLGNQHFADPQRQSPHTATDGRPGEARTLRLTLKLIADVGMVGFPNAGKSTMLSVLSAARPKIADYPFTTLEPHLGIVSAGEYASFVLADIPGLIEGASAGKGLGHQFLRHLERTRVLLFLVDCMDPDPAASLETLRGELAAYSDVLAGKPSMVAVTKADLLPPGADPVSIPGRESRMISAHSGLGLKPLVRDLWALVSEQV